MIQRRSNIFVLLALAMSFVVLRPTSSWADEMPLTMQALMFKRVVMFDRTIATDAKLAIVYVDEQGKAEELKNAFGLVGQKATTHKLSDAEALSSFNAVYVFPKGMTKEVRDAAIKHKILTLSGNVGAASSGDAAVAIDMKEGKPNIVVNLNLAKKQGHDLTSDLLKLATIVQ
jgi:hypothetical protein